MENNQEITGTRNVEENRQCSSGASLPFPFPLTFVGQEPPRLKSSMGVQGQVPISAIPWDTWAEPLL